MPIGSIIGAIAGPLIGGAFSAFGQERANRQTADNIAQQLAFQRESQASQQAFGRETMGRQEAFGREIVGRAERFQERSQRNRYQWTMQDMRAAGLNPLLAYQQGGGGSLQGATASLGTPQSTAMPGAAAQPKNVFSGATDTANSAVAAYRTSQQMKRVRQEIRNLETTEKNIATDTEKKRSEMLLQDNLSAKAAQEFRLLREQTNSAKAAAAAAKTEEEFWNSNIGKWLKRIDLTGRALNPYATGYQQVGPRRTIIRSKRK